MRQKYLGHPILTTFLILRTPSTRLTFNKIIRKMKKKQYLAIPTLPQVLPLLPTLSLAKLELKENIPKYG